MVSQPPRDLNFLAGLPDGPELRGMLPSYLKRKAAGLLEQRRAGIARLVSERDLAERKRYLRERMIASLGSLPERTPLNARVTGFIDRQDFRIEKIVFESQPRFFVTANLYLPKTGRPPYPAILFPLGHEAGAKAHSAWQQALVSFARKGFVGLAWDTICQGERIQLYDEDLKDSKVLRSTTEHTIQGIQCLLVGDSLARYTVWDGIRALDYLLSRPEVDPQRVGCTGNSGGGTHTAYLAALEDRIHVAAPSCYITSWMRLLETIGPQDAEQCLPPWLADGLDHGDFILAFAPKPYLMLTAIRDFFSITGARETFREVKSVYERLGAGEKMSMFEADDGHGYTPPRRLASYGWFSRWLKGAGEEQTEPEVTVLPEEELFSTPTGVVATSLGGETVFTLNQKRLEAAAVKPGGAADVARMIEFQPRKDPVPVRSFGRIERSGYRIEKLVYESEPGIQLPSLLYIPESPAGRKPAAIYVHSQGKAAAHADVESLVGAGLVILAIDARGWGETAPDAGQQGSDWPSYFGDYNGAMTALLTGKPLVAMRAEDIVRGIDLVAHRAEVDATRISVFGRDGAAVPTLYAAAFDSRVRQAALEGMLVSYRAVISQRIHRGVFENVVRGALRLYDLPDLAAWMAPRRVLLVDAVDPLGKRLNREEVTRAYARAANVRIARRQPGDNALTLYRDWLR